MSQPTTSLVPSPPVAPVPLLVRELGAVLAAHRPAVGQTRCWRRLQAITKRYHIPYARYARLAAVRGSHITWPKPGGPLPICSGA